MDFILIFNYRNQKVASKNVTGTIMETVVTSLEQKTTEYLQNENAPDCKVEFHTEADHIPHVTLQGLDEKHVEPLTSILNACIQ
jgi:hypothetical protein